MMDKTLIICNTKNRPQICQRMLTSFHDTRGLEGTQIVFCLDYTDKHLHEYVDVLADELVMIKTPNYVAPVVNMVTKQLRTDYDYYGIINDDHVYRTKDWDKELIGTIKDKGNGWGMAHANCLWHDSDIVCRHPSGLVLSANIVKVLDYLIWPGLRNFKTDTYLRDLVEPLKLQFYREDVVIEHMHVNVGKAEMDDNYRWSYCAEEQTLGNIEYAKWKLMWGERDRNKIRKALGRPLVNVNKGV